jgi:hypothetical protein
MKYAITTFCAAALVVVSGCGGGDDGDGDDDPVDYTTAYAISSVVYDGDDATTYVALIGSLDAAEVDYDRALELPGRASIATFGGKLFVGGGDAPIIRRYVIEADGSFTADGTVSFANYGLTGALYIDDWGLNFIDAQKAYLTNSSDPPSSGTPRRWPSPARSRRRSCCARRRCRRTAAPPSCATASCSAPSAGGTGPRTPRRPSSTSRSSTRPPTRSRPPSARSAARRSTTASRSRRTAPSTSATGSTT